MAAITRFFSTKRISVVQIDAVTAARSAQLFALALQEGANVEFDWIWYADNMISGAHQRYCLQRAMQINPDSEIAHRALAILALRDK